MPKPGRIIIADARDLAVALNQQAVVILGVERDGTVTVTSFGEDAFKRRVIGDWAQSLWQFAVAACPFQTAFGWGNGGRPKRVRPRGDESPTALEYVERNTAPNADAADANSAFAPAPTGKIER